MFATQIAARPTRCVVANAGKTQSGRKTASNKAGLSPTELSRAESIAAAQEYLFEM